MPKRPAILVVETEYLIALEIKQTLESLGEADIVIARNAQAAEAIAEKWSDAALAIVEYELRRPDLAALIHRLRDRNIPIIAISADERLFYGAAEFPGMPILMKPVPTEDLAQLARSLLVGGG